MKVSEILTKIKALFDAAPPVAPADTTATGSTVTYKTVDGADVIVTLTDPTKNVEPAVGDKVTVAGAPAAEGDVTLEDGTVISVDATGAITQIQEPGEPVTTDLNKDKPAPTPAPAPAPAPVQMATHDLDTPEKVMALYNSFNTKFAAGTPEERIANLELVAKALMESCFGWQIREAQQKAATDQAIAIYKNDLATAQAAVTAANVKMAAQDKIVRELFAAVELMAEVPTAEPKTVSPAKTEAIARNKAKEDRFAAITASIQKVKVAY